MITLLNMCCLEYMAGLKDKAFDLAIVDPPYGIGDFNMKNHDGKRKVKWLYDWNYIIPTQKYFQELKRVSKKQIIWGANYFNCFDTGAAIVWFKDVRHPNMSKCEIASKSWERKVDYVRLDWSNTDKFNELRGEDIHPCEKPVALYKWLLKNYAKPGDRILDTHGGSMSIAIACHQMNFDLTLCEIDKDYFNAGLKRYNEAIKQVTLFKYEY